MSFPFLVWGTITSTAFFRPRVAGFLATAFLAAGLALALEVSFLGEAFTVFLRVAVFLVSVAGTALAASFLEEVFTAFVFATFFFAAAFFSL